MIRLTMIDLNEQPDENNGDPVYCTQHVAGNTEFVVESPNPPMIQKVSVAAAEGIFTDGHSSLMMAAPGNTQIPEAVASESDGHTLDGTGAPSNTGGTVANGFGDENDDEAWSQPKEPRVGMRFDTLEGAKNNYNSYSLQIGFSIKMNTSRKATKTRELIKQQFVCNKFRKPKVDDGGEEKIPMLDEIVDETKDDDQDEDIVFLDDDSKTKKTTKKRKRDTILQTGFKAKMVVKLIDGRWEVIHFVGEHNHPLVDKPSLTKYLRSHQGIPAEEKAFLTHLHNCNLTTCLNNTPSPLQRAPTLTHGRMMHIMSEFYGTELIVPYTTKHITNLKTVLNQDATKEGDMIETDAYFKDQQKEDPDFFYKIKYDEEDRVENIFWVDGASRKAYMESYHDCISFDTTYMTNMYNMPFVPFIGINRHGQSFMLGCGFVRQELASSFD
uniref:Protein FAR1-RELATED SEQUENCE n=1 Tax=Hordeum vulgare subsp. vulgare TaxID=112509 RepID=A0A8I6WEP7_HORVV